jgi:hypothetical protein
MGKKEMTIQLMWKWNEMVNKGRKLNQTMKQLEIPFHLKARLTAMKILK